MKANDADDLMDVQTFAERFRVDASVVRSWIRAGLIPFTLKGSRRMVRRSDILRPAVAPTPKEVLIGLLVTRDGMDNETAHSVVNGMEPTDVDNAIAEYAQGGHDGETKG